MDAATPVVPVGEATAQKTTHHTSSPREARIAHAEGPDGSFATDGHSGTRDRVCRVRLHAPHPTYRRDRVPPGGTPATSRPATASPEARRRPPRPRRRPC